MRRDISTKLKSKGISKLKFNLKNLTLTINFRFRNFRQGNRKSFCWKPATCAVDDIEWKIIENNFV